MASRDFTSEAVPIATHDEIGTLTQAFNQAQDTLCTLLAAVQAANRRLSGTAAHLRTTTFGALRGTLPKHRGSRSRWSWVSRIASSLSP
ncbi:MAG: HAMP domain-containing protein [Firmicutes bacterium]|nr:HAMP domain-containing protein [Bacillota bacterium]